MPDSKKAQTAWKQTLFDYVNAVNEAGLKGDDSLLRSVPDAVHRNRLKTRLSEMVRRESECGIRAIRSEVRARIERCTENGSDVSADVSLHVVRTCEQMGFDWQEERVERERIRFVRSHADWRLDTAEPLVVEGRQRIELPYPDNVGTDEWFERRDAMPSVPYINLRAGRSGERVGKSKVYAGSGADGGYGSAGFPRGVPYRRESVVAYAERWWNEPNPAYENFEVNCTNYVSQCLFAGQAPMNYTGRRESGWWYQGYANGREMWSYSWAVADSLQRYLSQPRGHGLRAVVVDAPDRLSLGDVICYDWDGSGRFGHNTVVTAFAPDGMPLVNANTVSSRHRYWDYRDSYAWTDRTRYRFFHIVEEI